MNQEKISESAKKQSPFILGIMRMHEKSVGDAQNIIETAVDNGITMFDSADIYGEGESDKTFGQSLKQSSLNREDLFIQSKGGIITKKMGGPRYDFSKDHIIESVEGTLKRLRIDYLDAFLLHRPDPLMQVDEIAEAFFHLRHDGKVNSFGVSNFGQNQIALLQAGTIEPLQYNQLQFGLMHADMVAQEVTVNTYYPEGQNATGNSGLLAYCQQQQIRIQAWSPFQYGLISGSFIDHPNFPEVNEKLAELANKYQVGKNAIAAAWILKHPAHIQVITGTMSPDHLKDTAKALTVNLTNQEWYDLYLSAGYPLP